MARRAVGVLIVVPPVLRCLPHLREPSVHAARRNATVTAARQTVVMPDPTRTPTSTKAGILRPDQLAEHVRVERAECSPELSPWVENYWSLRWDLPAGASYLSAMLPHPACNLSVEHGRPREEI